MALLIPECSVIVVWFTSFRIILTVSFSCIDLILFMYLSFSTTFSRTFVPGTKYGEDMLDFLSKIFLLVLT